MEKEQFIEKVRRGFDTDFAKKGYMENRTFDDKHLNSILEALTIKRNQTILDLGTGSGYLAFPIAQKHKDCKVYGLDIAVNTLNRNIDEVKEKGINNLQFVSYDGNEFPFSENMFDCVVTRYALHHFPDLESTFNNINLVMKSKGQLFISDPTPNDEDDIGFVDKYMQLKDDGHVKFRTKMEFENLANKHGFALESCFYTKVKFPSSRLEQYLNMSDYYDSKIKESYEIEIVGNDIYITENVLNMSFRKW